MLAMLLESHAVPQRRGGGTALSAAVHLAIIGGVVAAGAHTRRVAGDKPNEVPVTFTRPIVRTPVARSDVMPSTRLPTPRLALAQAPHVAVPITVPSSLPPIDFSHAVNTDPGTIVLGGASGAGHAMTLDVSGDDAVTNGGWTASEVLMHIVTSSPPRYPDALRRMGLTGRVLVRFTVDTAGQIDMQTVQILSATHELFARAVREALPHFRFRPAEVAGRRVRALAEMPFEFELK